METQVFASLSFNHFHREMEHAIDLESPMNGASWWGQGGIGGLALINSYHYFVYSRDFRQELHSDTGFGHISLVAT